MGTASLSNANDKKNQAEALVNQAATLLTDIDALIAAAEEAANNGGGDEPVDYGCIDDATTPQECLDEWVANEPAADISCGDTSIDITFIFGNKKWDRTYISSGANALDLD